MNRILNAIKLDVVTSRLMLLMSVIVLVGATIIGYVTSLPPLTIGLSMLFSVYFTGMVFSVHEKNHSDKLYGILPLKRSEMVTGRYLYGLSFGVVNGVLGGLLGYLVYVAHGITFDPFIFWGTWSMVFLYFCLAVSLSYAIYFKFSFAKTNVFTNLPLYLVMLFTILMVRRFGIVDKIPQIINFFSDKIFILPIIGVCGGLILLAISSTIANAVYKNKEL